MQRDDAILAFDIIYAIQRIKQFSENLTLETFQTDEMANEAIPYRHPISPIPETYSERTPPHV